MISVLPTVPEHTVRCPRPGCGFPSRYPVAAGIEVRLICGSCGHVYLSGDGLTAVTTGAGESGRGRVDDMSFPTIDEKEAAR